MTDAAGRTRDRLTTRSSAHITLNAGGTVYRFRVPVAAPALELARAGARARRRPRPRPRGGARARARARPAHRPRGALRRRVDLPDDPAGRRAPARPRRGARASSPTRARSGRHLTFRTAGHLALRAGRDRRHPGRARPPSGRTTASSTTGRRVWSQPGVVGGYLNRVLARLGAPPGPRSRLHRRRMIGGIVANNSSGMCCGVAQNSYHTLDALHFMLADGTVVDTRAPGRGRRPPPRPPRSARRAPGPARRGARGRARWPRASAAKFARKKTTAYASTPSSTTTRPAQILAHLMVGSQGTLGFLADVTLRTVPEPPAPRDRPSSTSRSCAEAGAAVAPLVAAGAAALEIMDAALAALAGRRPRRTRSRSSERTAALLVEFRADDRGGPAPPQVARAASGPGRLPPARARRVHHATPRSATGTGTCARGCSRRWADMRPSGTAVVIEDVVVPVERLAEAITDFQVALRRPRLRRRHHLRPRPGRQPALRVRQGLRRPRDRAPLRRLHARASSSSWWGSTTARSRPSTARAATWRPSCATSGATAPTASCSAIKALLDPDGILNPGVVLNDDPELHLKDLKPLPPISPLADRCIECGFCEPRCPSRDLTLTPRQRIVVTRELVRLSRVDRRRRRGPGGRRCAPTSTTRASRPARATRCARPRAR